MKLEIPNSLFNEEELKNTPKRFKRFLEEWSKTRERLSFTTFPNPGFDQIIILKDIRFYSLCSHHLLPFTGSVHIGYIPNMKICGLSKLARAVDVFAHRPQLQEKLTQNIADFLQEKLKPKGVIVVIEAEHYCMSMRGVGKPEHKTITSAVKGVFLKPETPGKSPKEEFFKLIGR